MPHQEAFTLIAPVDEERVASLERLLGRMKNDPGKNRVLPFAEIPGCHFGRVVLLPASKDLDGEPIPPQMLVLTDFDGRLDDHLEHMVDVAGDGIDRLFSYCTGYPPTPATRQDRFAFLRDKSVSVSATYVHRQGRTVEQIRNEDKLREALLAFLRSRDYSHLSASEVRRQIRDYVKSSPHLRWALGPTPKVSLEYRAKNALHFFTLPLALTVFGPVMVPAALLLVLLIRMQEEHDASEHIRPTPEQVQALTALEDYFAHNGFTAGGFVKPGVLRQAVIRAVLPLIGWGTRHLFTRDSLAGVKTIHFARWVPLDGGRRVVFASNYDGSMESYNNDFIDLVAWGLNLVFSNGLGYPRTRWLVSGGATREQEFKDYLRRHQIPTPVWYSAYPHLTARNIERNAKLRAGLRGRMNEREAQAWLQLL